jgi:hypothetical protein
MSQTIDQPAAPKPRRFRFQFGLKTLLLIMLLVAVYLAGRSSLTHRFVFAPSFDGTWNATFPRGAKYPVKMQGLGNGQYTLGGAGVLSGTYKWEKGQLIVVKPGDDRMAGLVWKWDGKQLVLVAEPANTPTGSSYTGTTLTRPPKP